MKNFIDLLLFCLFIHYHLLSYFALFTGCSYPFYVLLGISILLLIARYCAPLVNMLTSYLL